jgi:hypothetical protein
VRDRGRVVWPIADLGDGPAVAFEYPVLNRQLSAQYRWPPDAMANTTWFRISHYMVTVQFAALTDDLELSATTLEYSILQAAWMRQVLELPA